MSALALRLLRFPPMPEPGPGDELLRPSPKQFALDVLRWASKQLVALFGIAVSVAFLRGFDLPFVVFDDKSREAEAELRKAEVEFRQREDVPAFLRALDFDTIVWTLEGLAIASFLVQLGISGSLLRLGFRSRVYLVSDDKVRIREGLFTVTEQTFSVANIQNLVVRQGPLQHFLGIADLEISTAGGGAASSEHKSDDGHAAHNLHIGNLRSLDDAGRVRDRLRGALERHRHAGLGDAESLTHPQGGQEQLLEAATNLRNQARALRLDLAERPTP